MTPTDYIRDYQARNQLDPKALSQELLISTSHYYKFFTDSNHKRSPSPQLCRIAQLTEFIKQQGLEVPPPFFEG